MACEAGGRRRDGCDDVKEPTAGDVDIELAPGSGWKWMDERLRTMAPATEVEIDPLIVADTERALLVVSLRDCMAEGGRWQPKFARTAAAAAKAAHGWHG